MGLVDFEPTLRSEDGQAGYWRSSSVPTPLLDPPVEAMITQIASVPGAWCPSVSPDGSRVAYVTDRTGIPRVEVVELDRLHQVDGETVSGPDEEAISVAWSPDGGWLAYLVSPGGSIRAELHAVRPDGSDHRLLAGAGEFETAFAGVWTTMPGRYVFSLADGVSPNADVCVVDVESAVMQPVPAAASLGFCTVTGVGRDGTSIVVRSGPRNQRRLWLLPGWDANGFLPGEPVRLLSADFPALEQDTGEDGRWSADRHCVYLRTGAGRDRIGLARVPIDANGRPGRLDWIADRPDADLEAYALRADGTGLLVWNVAGVSTVEIWDLAARCRLSTVPIPGSVMAGWSLRPDGAAMIAEVNSAVRPRSLFEVGLDPDQPSASLADLPPLPLPRELIEPTRHRYRAPDGLELEGWLYRPRLASVPGPTVVAFHGGPESQERPAFSLLTQSQLAAGLTVFLPNVRGSTGYGARFTAADDGLRRVDSFQDVPATVTYLVESGIAAPGRIGVQGWSYGGYLALTAMTRWPDLFAAAATHAGMSDLLSFFAETEPWMAAASVTEYGDPETEADMLRVLSPLTHLDNMRAPVLLVHGDRDTNVPTMESVRAHVALKAAGIPTELLLLPGEGHTIVRDVHRAELARAITRWFVRWLTGPTAPPRGDIT